MLTDLKTLFLKKNLWSTQYEGLMLLQEMETRHINNCINKCLRENWRMWALPKLQEELKRRNLKTISFK